MFLIQSGKGCRPCCGHTSSPEPDRPVTAQFPGLLSGLSGLRVTQRKQHLEFPSGRAGCMRLRHPQYKTAGLKSLHFFHNQKEGKNQAHGNQGKL